MTDPKTRWSSPLGRAFALFVALLVATAAVAPATARADDAEVHAVANSVFKFNWHIDGRAFSRGSCFLINDRTIITANHCTTFSEADLDRYEEYAILSRDELRDRTTYSITIDGDVEVGATLLNASENQDYAILKLDQAINGHNAVTVRDSSTVAAPEPVYSVGFPANSDIQVLTKYNENDVTFKKGTVSKTESIFDLYTAEDFHYSGYFIQSDCTLSGGDSGGPMVDEHGNVIGVAVAGNNNYYFASASDQFMNVFDQLGIKYTSAGDAGAQTTAAEEEEEEEVVTYKVNLSKLNDALSAGQAVDQTKYTEESYQALASALAAGNDLKASVEKEYEDEDEADEVQDEVDAAATAITTAQTALVPKPEGLPTAAIVGIVAGVLAVVALVVVLVMRSRKKKDDAPAAATSAPPASTPGPTPALNPTAAPASTDPGTSVLGTNATDTTVLGGNATDTEILVEEVDGGMLTRMNTNEHVPITTAEFTIGRDGGSVDYCVEGNTNISRIHARIVVRDDGTYIVDNDAPNKTRVNGVVARPGQEVPIKSGDVIQLADEKFKYTE